MQSSLRTDAEARWFRESRNEIGEEFRMSLDAQSEIQQIGGRAAVLDFSKVTTLGHVPNTEHAYSPKHLLDILSDREASHRGGIRRRLIILEDLGRNWIQVLGSRLGMPLSVFERHWARPEHHSLGKVRIPLGQDNRYHFVLSYVQSHPIVITGRNKGSTYRIACNAYRTIAFNVKEDNLKHQASDQLVTYWATDSNNDGEGGWTAVLLVDPPLAEDLSYAIYREGQLGMPLNCFQDGDLAPLPMLSKVQYHSENHRPQVQTRLLTPQETPCIAAKLAYKPRFQPSGTSNSMLQDLLDADHGIPSSDPSTSTFGCRRLILARAAATLQTAFSDALNASMSSSTGVDEMSSFNFDTFETTAWNSHWEGKKFTGLWEQRENLELLRYKLHQNRQVIQKTIRDKDNPAVIPKDSSHPDDPANKTTADLEYHRNAQLLMYHQEENDRLEWVDLDNTAEYINQVIVRTTASYLQTVQAREAQVSNFQARSVGQLTRMATIFVPVSLCAAIFSMSGQFAAGDSHFWLFWAVSMPVAGILIFLMYTPLGSFIQQTWTRIQGRVKKVFTVKRETVQMTDLERSS